MRKVLTLACLLAVAHHVAAQCTGIPTYTQNLVPECAPNDVYVKWPNYENQATYYQCNGVNNPVQMSCGAGMIFCFVLQQCVSCTEYIPPVQCSQLKTQNPPNCVPIGQSSSTVSPGPSEPTPFYPSSSTTAATTKSTTVKTTATTVVTVPTVTVPTVPAETTVPTVPTEPTVPTVPTPPSGSTIPPPPSPVTNDPNIPMPPTPDPTPPSVPATPPPIAQPNSSG